MKIELREIPIREIVNGFSDDQENGVVGFNGKLNIRPAYQREFVYDDKKRNAVINTVRQDFPLNVMYWAKNGDNSFELLDGQQRTISICQFINQDFSIDYQYFHGLTDTEKNQILDYKLMIYICEGTDKEKLDWFKIINIAGEKLTDQELRNAIYTGPWLTDAKKYFSKTNCPAYQISSKLVKGTPIRQDYLETALKWISDKNNIVIEEYMGQKQTYKDSNELWIYFQNVINWVNTLFPNYRNEMKGIEWGILYNKYHQHSFNSNDMEERLVELLLDDDVTKKKGTYEYLLSGDERYLSIRQFSLAMKREAFERQKGVCPMCKETFSINEMQGDHIVPWSKGGKTIASNCQMLCAADNRKKLNI